MENKIKENGIKKIWKDWRVTIFILLAILIAKSSVLGTYNIASSSMTPTLSDGDIVTVDMLAYDVNLPFTNKSLVKLNEPEYLDIVGVFIDDTRYVKRVIAKPNDKVKILNNVVYLNGVEKESIENIEMGLSLMPDIAEIKLTEDQYFVLSDSENNGVVSRSDIIGKVSGVAFNYKSLWTEETAFSFMKDVY